MRSRPTLADGYDYVGEFVAFDPVTGERAWEYRPESGSPMSASALATAGGIVFGGTSTAGSLRSIPKRENPFGKCV